MSTETKNKIENWAFFDKNNKQHKQILSLAIQAGWSLHNDRYGEVADLKRLSDFLKSDKSPVKKPLKEMETKELSKIIYALEQIVKHEYK